MNGREFEQIDINNPRAIIDFIDNASIDEVISFIDKYKLTPARKDLKEKKVKEMTDDEIVCLALTRHNASEFYDSRWKRFTTSRKSWKQYGRNTQKHLNLISTLLYPRFRPRAEFRLLHLESPTLLSKAERAYVKEQQKSFATQLDKYPENRFLNLVDLNLGKVKLKDRDLCHLHLPYTHLNKAKLARSNLSNTSLYLSQLNEADLHDAILKRSSLINSYVTHANLRGANLKKASLEATWFYQSDLKKANLKKTYLGWTSFNGANLKGANLIGSIFDQTTFTNAKFDAKTKILPLVEQIAKNPSLKNESKDVLIDILTNQLDQLEQNNQQIKDGIHGIRWVIVKNIETVISFIDDKEKKSALLDAAIQHPIFAHRHAIKKYANSILGLFTTYQIPTDSQDVLMQVQSKISATRAFTTK